MKTAKIFGKLSMCFLAVSVALMWLPSGIAMRFVSDPGPPMEFVTFRYSYISGMPIGYGNLFPIVIAVLSFAILLMLMVNEFGKVARKRDPKTSVLICLSICIIASPLSWLVFGGAYSITMIGIAVFVLHVVALLLQVVHNRVRV